MSPDPSVMWRGHWSVRLSPSLIGIDNVYYYPFRMSHYTELQKKVMWRMQGSVSLMVPMSTTKLRSVIMHRGNKKRRKLMNIIKCPSGPACLKNVWNNLFGQIILSHLRNGGAAGRLIIIIIIINTLQPKKSWGSQGNNGRSLTKW